MKLLCAKQFAIAFCLLNLVMVVTGYAEEITGVPDAAVSVTTASYLISELLIYKEINMSRVCKSGVDPYLEKSSRWR